MAYTITRSDGSTITVSDNTVDSTYSVQLVGKNRTNYGVPINENFIRLMQNFANSAAPGNPLPGQTWWDTASGGVMKVFAGNVAGWKIISGITASNTAPTGTTLGDAWFDRTTSQVKVWDGTQWVLIGPGNSTESGFNGIVNELFNGNYVASIYANNIRVAIVSANSFSISPAITGFEVIKRGINYNVALADIQTVYGNVVGNTISVSANISAGNINAVTGILSVTGNATLGNLSTTNGTFSGVITATGNLVAGNISTGAGTFTGALAVTGNATLGNISAAAGGFTGNVTLTNGTANVLAVNTLTVAQSLSANVFSASGVSTFNANVQLANLSVNAISNLGNVGNVIILGGSSGFVLTTDGSGALSWANLSSGSGSGNVNSGTASHLAYYASTGTAVSGSGANLTWNGANLLAVLGTANVTTLNATGNVSGGNVIAVGVMSATGNVSGGNVTTTGLMSATGNVSGGNVTTTGLISATGNVSGGNVTTTGLISATGNVSGGNISAVSNLTAPVAALGSPSATVQGVIRLGSFGSIQTLFEKTTVDSGTKPSTVNFDVQDTAVVYYTNTASSGNFTVNFRGNSTVSLNNILDVGQTSSLALMITNGATAVYPTTIRIDGSSATVKWLDGAAPTNGFANSVDVYNFGITKTAANTYNILGSFNRFA